MEILIEKSAHKVVTSGLVQDFRVPVDEAKRQPDEEEGHQGHLGGDVVGDHVDGVGHEDDDDLNLHLNENGPTEEDGILSIEGIPPEKLKMTHLNISQLKRSHRSNVGFQFCSPSAPHFCPPVWSP